MSSTVWNAGMPWTVLADALTGYTGPAKPPATTLCSSSPPTVPRWREAPTTATDVGSSTRRTAAAAATRSRSSKRATTSGESELGTSSSSVPWSLRMLTGNPLSRNTSRMRLFSASTCASSTSIPDACARAATCASSSVASPRPWWASATAKAISAEAGPERTYCAWPTTAPSGPPSASRPKRSR